MHQKKRILTGDRPTDRLHLGHYVGSLANRVRLQDEVEGNPVFIYHQFFNHDREEVEELKARYRSGKVGDIEVKERLAAAINAFLEPMRQRRADYAAQPRLVDEILAAGNERMRAEGKETMELVREAMGLSAPISYNQ